LKINPRWGARLRKRPYFGHVGILIHFTAKDLAKAA